LIEPKQEELVEEEGRRVSSTLGQGKGKNKISGEFQEEMEFYNLKEGT